MVTSNKGSRSWAVLGDELMAVPLIVRLLHDCHIANIRGSRYRIRPHR